MAVVDLDTLDTSTMMPIELTETRHQLYLAAQFHENEAAKYWKAYWQTMGLSHRPLTKEQAELQEPTTVKPKTGPRPKKRTGIQIEIG